MSEVKKGAPKYAQLVSEVRKLAQRVTVLEGRWADEALAEAEEPERLDTWGPMTVPVVAISSNALCPGCGEIVGECADTCAYERKHAVRVERYGADAA